MISRMLAIKDFGTNMVNGYKRPFWAILPEWVCSVLLVVLATVSRVVCGDDHSQVHKRQTTDSAAGASLCHDDSDDVVYGQQRFYDHVVPVFHWWYHSSQYLVVTSAYHLKSEACLRTCPFSQISKMLLTRTSVIYFGHAFWPGLLLFISELVG